MDVKKKEALEQRIVLGLVVVLLVTFMTGPAKQLRLFNFFQRAHPLSPTPEVSGEQTTTSHSLWTKMEDAAEKTIELSAPETSAPSVKTSPAPMVYTAQELRDPLKSLLPAEPPASAASSESSEEAALPPETAAPALRLQGLLWGGPKPKAIINDNVYGIGDSVEGATITSIDRRQVTLEFQGTVLSLTTVREQVGQASLARTVQR